jgi:hypothetical protein
MTAQPSTREWFDTAGRLWRVKQLSRIPSTWGGKPEAPEPGLSFSHGDYSFLHFTLEWVDPTELSSEELQAIVDANELEQGEKGRELSEPRPRP